MFKIFKNSDFVLALGFVTVLTVMVIPMPTFMIDLMITIGIAASFMMLLTAVYTIRVLDFSVFPTILLMVTLFRLSVNVATTRAILLNGSSDGTSAAGSVIRAFGDFVVGG